MDFWETAKIFIIEGLCVSEEKGNHRGKQKKGVNWDVE